MLILYKHYRKWSLFFFFIALGDGANVLPPGSGLLKMSDMALAFILLNILYHLFNKSWYYFRLDLTSKKVLLLCVFVVSTVIFSWIYYNVPLLMSLQMGRYHLYVLAYFLLRDQPYKELLQTFKLLGIFTLICSIIYCIQIPLGIPLLINNNENLEASSSYAGLIRFTNIPYYLNLFLFLNVFHSPSFVTLSSKKKHIVTTIFFLSRLLTFGRTAILSTFAFVAFGVCWKRKKYIKWIVLIFIIFLPVISLFRSSLESRNTFDDIQGILNGEYKTYVTGYKSESTTMLYRFAWVYERAKYLSERPFVEQLMGMPYVSDSSPLIKKYAKFSINGYDGNDESQILRSYDIAWGNLVTQFGILGSIILLNLWLSLCVVFYKNRNNSLAFAALIYLLSMLFLSIAGMGFSYLKNIVPFFALMTLLKKTPNKNINKKTTI